MTEPRLMYDVYRETPESERKHYVYMWFERVGGEWIPFYVGKGSGRRVDSMGSRSKVLREYVVGREIKRMIVASGLPSDIAYIVEGRAKVELKRRGFKILDGEDDAKERKHRQAEGIKRAKDRGVRFGRTKVTVDLTLLPGESVSEACERLGVSRSTFYRKVREVRA